MAHSLLKTPKFLFRSFLYDYRPVVRRWRALPYFLANLSRYQRLNQRPSFRSRVQNWHYTSFERFENAGTAQGHYFFQDNWAAQRVYAARPQAHVDVGSRLDGFVGHVLPFCPVTFVDIRPLDVQLEGLTFQQGSIVDLPFATDSVPSLSCLHVIEHIGLGRYGDPVDPEGFVRAAHELARVLQPGGQLLIGTPIGREGLYFDAHRVFDPQTILDAFAGLRMVEFSLIDDRGQGVQQNATFDDARACNEGCGLFRFTK